MHVGLVIHSEEVSRGMLILRANTMLKGVSGVRPLVVNMLLEFVNRKIHPVVPQQGSLGASGDLAPLSHLALVLLGEGEVFYKGNAFMQWLLLQKKGLSQLNLKQRRSCVN